METQHYTDSREDTRQAWLYHQYDKRKAEVFIAAETLEEYHAKLAELIDELGV